MAIERFDGVDPAELLDLSAALRRVAEALTSSAAARPEQPPAADLACKAVAAEAVRNVIRGRRLRDRSFPNGLFADPAWDMLLDLYAAQLEGRQVSVSSLCLAAGVPATTALRWINILESNELIIRQADPSDLRRVHLSLSPVCAEQMEGLFRSAVASATPPI